MRPNDPSCFKNAIFLHDALMSSNLWRIDDMMDRMHHMFQDYHVFAPDMRGFGRSSYKHKLKSYWDFVDDINEFMDERKMKDALFIGNTFGSFISQLFSMKYPERSLGMILMSPNTMDFPPRLFGDDFMMKPLEDTKMKKLEEKDKMMETEKKEMETEKKEKNDGN